MANDDNLDLEFNVNGDGERAIERIKGKLRDLGTTAEYASSKQVSGANEALAKYKAEADVLDEIAQKEARIARAAAQTRLASNRVVASNASTSASVANSSTSMRVGDARADLAAQKVLTEEVRSTNMAREQENRNLLTAGRLLTEQERQQSLIQQRTIANAREQQRQQAMIASQVRRDESERLKLIENRAGRERRAALAAERNRSAISAGALTSGSTGLGERRASLAAEKIVTAQDVEQTNALRYALYDTAQTATLVGTAIAAIGTASVAAAAQGEQQFANLSATIGNTSYDLQGLNKELLDLTTENPVNLSDTIGVAQLGAQMNIANSDLDEFTKTITQFSATTNVTSESAAESFGRISQLLNVPADQFKNLSSAVYQVGVDSVATESQILKTAEEISGSASAYGFTAKEVVGLSGAFASLAIQPEQARGATTRIFNQIETAVSSSGPKLDNYARILGTTREAAADLWKTDPSGFFDALIHGLAQSEDRLADLKSIGATGVFDTNVLQRLSENADFLTQSLDTSKSAYDKGTAAAEAYAKVSDTLISRLKELGNSLVELGINAGAPLLAVLSPIVDTIKLIVNTFADMPPIVLTSLAALTLLVGGYVLFQGATATAIAAVIGLRYVMSQLAATAGGTGLSVATLRTQMSLLWKEMGITTAASTRLTGTIGAAGIGARVAATGFSAMGLAMRLIPFVLAITLASQLAEGLYDANKASFAAANGFGVVATSAKNAKIGGDEITESFKNAKQVIDDLNNGDISNNAASFLGDVFNVTDFTKQAKNEIAAIDERLAKMVADGQGEKAAAQVNKLGLEGKEIAQFLPSYSDSLTKAGDASLKLGDDSLSAADQLSAYDQALKDAQASVDQLFGSLNQTSDFGNSIQQLFSGIYDAGNAFGYLSETGRTNLANLQDSIAQTIAYGQSLGLSSSNSVALLFYQLQQSGVDTAGLLQLIASQPYVFSADLDISKVQQKLAQLGVNGGSADGVAKNTTAFTNLSGAMNQLAVSAPRASTGVKKAGKAASDAAKEVKTLSDYASDLNTVFNDATKYRFGVTDALQDISDGWADIREKMADQKKEIADNRKKNADALAEYRQKIVDTRVEIRGLRADLAGLQAQLSQKKYFLSIAVQYGDTLRSQQLGADIADINSQIASKQNDVGKAQKELKTPFESTTISIDKQKTSLGDLYESYQDAIVEYARSGMSQEDLARKTEALRQDFIKQATQAGYSKAAIDKYSRAFDDLTYAIRNVPRKITVSANTNPAVQALNDFLAKANKAKATPSVSADGGVTRQNGVDAGRVFGDGVNQGIKDRLSSAQVTMQLESKFGKGQAVARSTVGGITFAEGGYVPGRTPSDRRVDNNLGYTASGAVVGLQGGEPIMTNAARSKYGDAMFDAINSLRFQPSVVSPTIVMSGGGGSGYTELSPTDRGILMDIVRAAGLTISTTALERSVGAANVAASRRRTG